MSIGEKIQDEIINTSMVRTSEETPGVLVWSANCTDQLDALIEREIAREEMIAALEPFARIADLSERMRPETGIWVHASTEEGESFAVTVGDCRKAREALAKAKESQS